MHNIDEKPKRKNENKRKGHDRPLSSVQMAALVLMVAFGTGIAIVWMLRPLPSARPQYPINMLTYTSDNVRYGIDLRTGQRDVIAMYPDPVQIPHVSPDGQWVAFWRIPIEQGDRDWQLIVQEIQKPETQRVLGTFIGQASALRWSPDSTHLVFSAYFNFERPEFCACDSEIFIIDRETGEHRRLTVNAVFDSDPFYSPDGSHIVYTSALDNYNRLWIMDLATEEFHLLTPDLHGYTPVWSPDGKWIAFMTTSFDYLGDIWIIRPDGTDAQSIASTTAQDSNPMWLP